jgi:hypothetical protein
MRPWLITFEDSGHSVVHTVSSSIVGFSTDSKPDKS